MGKYRRSLIRGRARKCKKKKKKRKSKTHGPNHLSWTAYHQNNPFINHPGTTARIPLNLAPAPFLPDGLYNNEDNNLVRITTKASTCPLRKPTTTNGFSQSENTGISQ